MGEEERSWSSSSLSWGPWNQINGLGIWRRKGGLVASGIMGLVGKQKQQPIPSGTLCLWKFGLFLSLSLSLHLIFGEEKKRKKADGNSALFFRWAPTTSTATTTLFPLFTAPLLVPVPDFLAHQESRKKEKKRGKSLASFMFFFFLVGSGNSFLGFGISTSFISFLFFWFGDETSSLSLSISPF